MKNLLFILFFLTTNLCMAQILENGYYNNGISLCYIKESNSYKLYLETYRGSKSEYSCVLFFDIKNNGIYTINENNISQTIKEGDFTVINKNHFKFRLNQQVPECRNASPIDFEKYNNFSLVNRKNWIDIRLVTSEKCRFYKSNSYSSLTKAYIIKGDVVKVLKSDKNFLYVEYENFMNKKHSPVFIWIKKSDCKTP